jgi:hypothetical protein
LNDAIIHAFFRVFVNRCLYEHRFQLLFSASRIKNKLDAYFITCADIPSFFNFAVISRCICGNDFRLTFAWLHRALWNFFFVTLLLARLLIKLFYANTFFAVSLAVSVMTILEGWISLSILGMLETELNQSSLMLTSTLPLAVLHGLVTPFILQSVIWGENHFIGDTA